MGSAAVKGGSAGCSPRCRHLTAPHCAHLAAPAARILLFPSPSLSTAPRSRILSPGAHGVDEQMPRAGTSRALRGCPGQIAGAAAGPLPGDELRGRPARGGLCGRKGQTIISLCHCWRGHGRGQHDSRANRGGTDSHPDSAGPPSGTWPQRLVCHQGGLASPAADRAC